MARFRSSPSAKYYDDLDEYRRGVSMDGSVATTLFEIVDQVDGSNRAPWLTFVLGSGCLAPTDSTAAAVETPLASIVADGLAASGLDVDDDSVAHAARFVRAMVEKKLPDASDAAWLVDRAASDDPKVVPWPLATAAALAAAVATTVFAELMLDGPHVLDRADKEVIRYRERSDGGIDEPRSHRALVDYLRQVQRLVGPLKRPDQRSVHAYERLLVAISTELASAQPELWRAQVEALTAFAWHFMTDGTSIYPGWADMLMFQAASSEENLEEFDRVPFLRRPKVQAHSKPMRADSVLFERLRRVTRRSFEHDDGARDDFYARVARIVLQQAELSSGRGSRLPLAIAFSASFDVELELALWDEISRGATSVEAFAVVIPVYTVDSGIIPPSRRGSEGGPPPKPSPFNTELHWLWREITPAKGTTPLELIDAGPDGLESGALGAWQRIDPRRPIAPALRRLPIVVHLAGAPLFTLDEQTNALFGRGVLQVHHALLLDENMATVQFTEDLLDDGHGKLHSEFLRGSDGKGPTAPRFWAFVGTQLADPAIRFRLIANELRAFRDSNLADSKADASRNFDEGVEHGGVVINDWVPAAEREVFRWHGYDIVRGKAQDLLVDLDDFHAQTARRGIRTEEASDHGAA